MAQHYLFGCPRCGQGSVDGGGRYCNVCAAVQQIRGRSETTYHRRHPDPTITSAAELPPPATRTPHGVSTTTWRQRLTQDYPTALAWTRYQTHEDQPDVNKCWRSTVWVGNRVWSIEGPTPKDAEEVASYTAWANLNDERRTV